MLTSRMLGVLRWQVTVLVGQGQLDLSDVARRAVGGAVEDHLFHIRAAQLLGARLAHDPFQGLYDIGFATAVRAGFGPGFDMEIGRVDKALEALEAEFVNATNLFLALPFRRLARRAISSPMSVQLRVAW